jgi:hypothetical protein
MSNNWQASAMAVIPGESYLTATLEIAVFTGTSFRDTVC